MPRAIKKEQHLATPRKRLTHARKRLAAEQTAHFDALSRPAPGRRFRRAYRFHPAPGGKTAVLKSAVTVTPPQKNYFEKQTHLKVPLKCAA